MKKKTATFLGGIHPPDKKSLSAEKNIQTLLPKEELIFPLSQHIGAPAIPIVAIGDSVKIGTKIAEANGFVSVPIHASVSGNIKAIQPHRLMNGTLQECIIIANDQRYESENYVYQDASELSNETILGRIKEAGVVGMGGAGFPTHVKLSIKEPDKIHHILINGAECEPYLTSDYRLMLEQAKTLIKGIKIVLQLFKKSEAYLCIEDNKPNGIQTLRKLCENEPRIHVQPLKTKYPQGGERFLIKAVIGKEINATTLPADIGCIVDNIATMIAIYDAVCFQKPLTHRVVTVSGEAIHEACNYYVPCGIRAKELITASGGFDCEVEKLISGGPMMGTAMFDDDVPITKTNGGIIALAKDEIALQEEMNCINCGRCVSVCPEKLIPSRLSFFARKENQESFQKWYGMECVECGCCSYICPSHRSLTQNIRYMRQKILKERKKDSAKGGKTA